MPEEVLGMIPFIGKIMAASIRRRSFLTLQFKAAFGLK